MLKSKNEISKAVKTTNIPAKILKNEMLFLGMIFVCSLATILAKVTFHLFENMQILNPCLGRVNEYSNDNYSLVKPYSKTFRR